MLWLMFDAAIDRAAANAHAPASRQRGDRLKTHAAAAAHRSASSALAVMAAGAAHELNNPLTVISGRTQLLLTGTPDGDDARNLRTIRDQADRASNMINELISTAKPDAPQPMTVRLGDWVAGQRQYWRGRYGDHAGNLQVHLSDPAVRMWVDPLQLDTAMREILDNAHHAGSGDNIRVSINSPSVASDETIVLSVSDDGRGMTPDILAHAFDPFFSHRRAGRGRGLGLTRAQRLVEVNGGRMWIDSCPDRGTTVHLVLPSIVSRPRRTLPCA